jgi:hypothetical protein
VGCQNPITPLTSSFLLARERPDRCLWRLVQNLISCRSLRIHSASCGTPGELEGQRRDRVLTAHTQDRDLNLVLEPRTQPPAEHINQSTNQGIEEPQEHGPQPAPTGHGRLKTPFKVSLAVRPGSSLTPVGRWALGARSPQCAWHAPSCRRRYRCRRAHRDRTGIRGRPVAAG